MLGDVAHEPAVVHDWLYYLGLVPRDVADKVLLEAMGVIGLPWWRRWPIYAGVRVAAAMVCMELSAPLQKRGPGGREIRGQPGRAGLDKIGLVRAPGDLLGSSCKGISPPCNPKKSITERTRNRRARGSAKRRSFFGPFYLWHHNAILLPAK